MAGKNTAAFGLYKSRAQAESAVDTLRSAGFRSDDISVLMPDKQSSEEFAHEKNTKAPEGTTTAALRVSSTTNPSIRSRLEIMSPGTARGPDWSVSLSYWDRTPQQTTRP